MKGMQDMIAGKNEEKRSKIWNIVMTVSTIVIILIAVFFIVKIFTSNPLEGTWANDGGNLKITIGSGGSAEIQWPEKFSELDIKVGMTYEIDKKNKTLQLRMDEEAIQTAADASDGALTAEAIESAINTLESSFDYSVDGRALTLTDREYGDQFFFEKE